MRETNGDPSPVGSSAPCRLDEIRGNSFRGGEATRRIEVLEEDELPSLLFARMTSAFTTVPYQSNKTSSSISVLGRLV